MQRRRSPRNIYRLPAVRRPVQNAAPVRLLEVNHTGDNELTWTFDGGIAVLNLASNLRVVNVTLGNMMPDMTSNPALSNAPEVAVISTTNLQAGWCQIVCTYGSSIDSGTTGWLFEAFDGDATIFDGPQDRTPTIGRIDEP